MKKILFALSLLLVIACHPKPQLCTHWYTHEEHLPESQSPKKSQSFEVLSVEGEFDGYEVGLFGGYQFVSEDGKVKAKTRMGIRTINVTAVLIKTTSGTIEVVIWN